MSTAQKVEWREVRDVYSGQRVEQIPVAEYTINIAQVREGAVVTLAPPGKRAADRIRPRRDRPHILPRAVPGFLDREQEQSLVGQALARGQVVDLHGPDGMGKTALVSRTMQTQLPSAFPDGLVYLSARHEAREDLLQELFETFFETSGHVKVTENDVRRHMAGKRALIVVDDANYLGEKEAEDLAQAVPQCAVLIAGRKQQVWQGARVLLRGLPRADAVALFERYWGPLAAQDRPLAEAICDALDHVPLAIVKAATIAVTRRVPLAEMLRWLQRPTDKHDPMGQAFQAVASQLSEGERRTLGGLAAPGGASVDIEALKYITHTRVTPEKLGRYLNRLQKMGLVHAHDSRYSLDDGLWPYARRYWADKEMRERAAEYYRGKAHQLRAQSRDPDEENVVAALRYYYQQKQWGQVVYIARAVEPYLATTGRWGQWRKRLNHAWQAAREMGDRATEAWAQNQLGIIAMGLGDKAAATKLFKGALGIWRALGDRAGMTITRWNLQILLGPPPPPPPKGKPPSEPTGGLSGLTVALGSTAAVLLVVLGFLAGVAILTPTPMPRPATRPPTTTLTPSPSPTTPAPVETTVTPSRTPRTPTITPSITPSLTPPCVCGDGICERDYPCEEDEYDCPTDCCVCGDGVCDSGAPCYENADNCFADCSLPDLVVITLKTAGPASITYPDDRIQVPIRVYIRNQGGSSADIFKVSTEYTGPSGAFLIGFDVPGQSNSWYPYTSAPLAAGSSVTFEGTVTFSSSLQGETVSLVALADSCAGEEFASENCRVTEIDEDNNESAVLLLSLPSN